MPRNGSGTYSLPQGAFVPGTVISSTAVNSDLSDIASALTGSLATDGQSTMTGAIKSAAGSAGSPSYTTSGDTTTGFFSGGAGIFGFSSAGTQTVQFGASGIQNTSGVAISVPIGTLTDFAGASAPSGWYLCFGQTLGRTPYAALFAVIGTTYGAGDTTTSFNLPDCRGSITAGKDNMGGSTRGLITNAGSGITGTTLGASGGAQNGTLVTSNLPPYTPSGTVSSFTPAGLVSINDTRIYSGLITPGSGGGGIAAASTNQNSGTVTQNIQITSGSITGSFSGNSVTPTFTGAAQGGTSTAVNKMPPTIIFNKIIYAGA